MEAELEGLVTTLGVAAARALNARQVRRLTLWLGKNHMSVNSVFLGRRAMAKSATRAARSCIAAATYANMCMALAAAVPRRSHGR